MKVGGALCDSIHSALHRLGVGWRRERTRRRNWPLRIATSALLALLAAYTFIWPAAERMRAPRSEPVFIEPPPYNEIVRARALEAITALWFFTLGATIGSFLNVVAYRLPRHRTLVWRPSHCPYCACAIKARDNIPIFGWLILRGRCRQCRLPISPRYPIVELITALIFVCLYFVELVSGGANLPVRSPNQYAGVAWTIYSPQWDLIGIYLFHCFLLCVLLAATLIRRDGLPIPKRLTALAYGVGLSLPAIWPWLRPVPWSLPQPDWMPSSTMALGLETGVAGVLVGGSLAVAISAATRRRGQSRSLAMENATIGTGLVGLFLGWQAVISIALVDGMLAVMLVAARRVKRVATSDNGALSCLLLATLLHLVLWRTSSRFTTWWPGPYSPLWVHGICAALAVTLGWVARRGTQ